MLIVVEFNTLENKYKRALDILKSKKLDEKIKYLEEDGLPLNNTTSFNKYKIDVDQLKSIYSNSYWGGGDRDNFQNTTLSDFSQDFLENSLTDTSGIIAEDGTVYAELPPGGQHFILGPIVDGFVSNDTKSYTNIGYLQKDTRQFIILARVDGQWKEGMNGDYPVWNGSENGLTVYNENFTIEMARWIREKINNNNYAKNVPYFYNGIELQKIDCPNCPQNMKGGNAIAPIEISDKNSYFTRIQIEKIDAEIAKFSQDILNTEIEDFMDLNLGKLARGMSVNQMKQFFKIVNKK